jgi:rare lipoprotein A
MWGKGKARPLAAVAAMGLALGGCGLVPTPFSHSATSHPTYKIGAPYTVNGVTYYPRVDYGYDKVGMASWYGEQFEGRHTANGEVFDLNELTAAHTTLPLPTIVEVINLDNNRSLRIRVNDRGPFARGRIIDLSRRAAQLLGFERSGTARVRVRVLKDESMRAAALAQRGIVSEDEQPTSAVAAAPETDTMAQTAAANGPARQFYVESPAHHVAAGPAATQEDAARLLQQMTASGYRDARIVID